jgi:prephenate dehydrogenase
MELMIESGNGEALEGLIEQASQTRAQWRMGSAKK